MPIQNCQQDGKPGYKYGEEGTCYVYNPNSDESKKDARKKAEAQGAAIEVNKGKYNKEESIVEKIKHILNR